MLETVAAVSAILISLFGLLLIGAMFLNLLMSEDD